MSNVKLTVVELNYQSVARILQIKFEQKLMLGKSNFALRALENEVFF